MAAAGAGKRLLPSARATATRDAVGPGTRSDHRLLGCHVRVGIGFEVGFLRPLADRDLALTVPSGVAAGDYDGDGLIDLVIVRGDTGPNLLYRNLGGLRFEELA